jgi:hypothetical protein
MPTPNNPSIPTTQPKTSENAANYASRNIRNFKLYDKPPTTVPPTTQPTIAKPVANPSTPRRKFVASRRVFENLSQDSPTKGQHCDHPDLHCEQAAAKPKVTSVSSLSQCQVKLVFKFIISN